MHAVVVDNVVKEFGLLRKKRVLAGVCLRIEAGTAVGLVGANGAGKTTLLKSMLGLLRLAAGRIELLGGAPRDPRVRASVGYVPERPDLPTAWTPRALLSRSARHKGVVDAASEVKRQLDRVGLAAESDRRLGTLSKGGRQRVALGCALLGRPKLLVLDEPTDGIDPEGRQRIHEILVEERAAGASILFNSHVLSETERLCDEVVFLRDGVIHSHAQLHDTATHDTWSVRWRREIAEATLIALGFARGAALGAWTFRGDAEQLDQAIAAARQHGAILVELVPGRELHQIAHDALRSQP